MSGTIDYYNKNTYDFIEGTINADVSSLYKRFLAHIPNGGRILDFGCGSGRDTKYFKDSGYQVEAIDGSVELCKAASEYSGVQVRCMGFFDFNAKDSYWIFVVQGHMQRKWQKSSARFLCQGRWIRVVAQKRIG